jgi:predicted AAA+ superfamily ATPase
MFIPRDLERRIRALLAHFPAVLVTGARQTGKTTLLRQAFGDRELVSLDLPSAAEEAESRPGDFLQRFRGPVTVDEVQYAPGLFRHLKIAIDADRSRPGRFLLTGSQKFQLMASVSDSLAGRCALVELHTLSATEYARTRPQEGAEWMEFLVRGGYPELHSRPDLPASDFYSSYVGTYLERDVRNLVNVGNLRDFERFLRVLAARNGTLLNVSDLVRKVGIAASTGQRWISILEASGVITLVAPYFENLGKRLTKSPRVYFLDTGLLCYLLGVDSVRAFLQSPFPGAVWESFVCGQLLRAIQLKPTAATLWGWRDAHGLEVDFVIDAGDHVDLVECKWSEHPQRSDAAQLEKVASLFPPEREVRLRIACRTPTTFPVTEAVTAFNAFEERDWLRSP